MLEHPIIIPRPIYYIPVHGTWAIDEKQEAWWKVSGAFAKYAKRFGVNQWDKLPPFIWSSDVNGFGYSFLSPKTKLTDWMAGGWSLYYYLLHIPVEHRNLIVHSHGLQPLAFCCSFGMQVRNVISVCSPIRTDMDFVYDVARRNIQNHLHIYDTSDWMQRFGQIGDGKWFGAQKNPYADVNHQMVDINHSDVLRVTGRMDYWNTQGWFDFLRQ